MDEADAKYAEIVWAIEQAMQEYGFELLQRFGDAVLILYRAPGKGNKERIQNTAQRIIEQYGMRALFEWSETNLQRLSITLLEADDERFISSPHSAGTPTITIREKVRPPVRDNDATVRIVPGTIGANINGSMMIFVPDSNNEVVYVTLPKSRDQYVECEIDPSATDVRLSSGFKVLVNLADKTIIAAAI